MNRRPTISVSDHAVVRWLEKVAAFDIVALRDQIARAGEVGVVHGAKAVVVAGGKLVLRDGAVVDVLKPGEFRAELIGFPEISVAAEIEIFRRAKRDRR